MKRKYVVCLCVALIGLAVLLAACDDGTTPTNTTSATSSLPTGGNCTSLACKSVTRRYEYLNDANKFGYFYGFIQGVSSPVIEYIVQGSVFPVDDMINSPEYQAVCTGGGSGACAVTLPQRQPDETYSTNGSALFGFTADGNYFEWNGPYAYSQTPLAFQGQKVVGCRSGVPGC
jgi:hypothetical protein